MARTDLDKCWRRLAQFNECVNHIFVSVSGYEFLQTILYAFLVISRLLSAAL